MENKRTYQGDLIEVIIKSFGDELSYDNLDKLQTMIQERLDNNLKFETFVSNVGRFEKYIIGDVSFKVEDLNMNFNFTVQNS